MRFVRQEGRGAHSTSGAIGLKGMISMHIHTYTGSWISWCTSRICFSSHALEYMYNTYAVTFILIHALHYFMCHIHLIQSLKLVNLQLCPGCGTSQKGCGFSQTLNSLASLLAGWSIIQLFYHTMPYLSPGYEPGLQGITIHWRTIYSIVHLRSFHLTCHLQVYRPQNDK